MPNKLFILPFSLLVLTVPTLCRASSQGGWAGQSAASPAAASYGDVAGAGQMAYASQHQDIVNTPAAAPARPAAAPAFPQPLPAAPATSQMICSCINVTPSPQQTPSCSGSADQQASAPALPSGSDSSAAPAQTSYSAPAGAPSDTQSYASPAAASAPAAQSYTAQFTASSATSAGFVAPAAQSYSAPAQGAQQTFPSQSSPAQQAAANNGGY